MAIHASSIKNSKQLQLILGILLDGLWHTTKEIERITKSCCVGSRIAELRAPVNGLSIECKFSHKTNSGSKVYKYRLINNN